MLEVVWPYSIIYCLLKAKANIKLLLGEFGSLLFLDGDNCILIGNLKKNGCTMSNYYFGKATILYIY